MKQHEALNSRTWFYQIKGTVHIAVPSGTLALNEGCCCIVQAGRFNES